MKSIVVTMLCLIALLLTTSKKSFAQPAELPQRIEPYQWSSGVYNGSSNFIRGQSASLVQEKNIKISGAPWLRLHFASANLGEGSYIEIKSLLDDATQRLDGASLQQRHLHSAFFNGDSVNVSLFVASQDTGVSIDLSEVIVGERGTQSRTICGDTDDRVPSNEPRVGRIDPIGCTGWAIDNGKLLTAGHCLNAISGNTNTLSYNIPQSLPDGTRQFPGPEDQYTLDASSFIFLARSIGKDYGVFKVFNNSVTGAQPIDRQGSYSVAQDHSETTIRVTGFGLDDGSTNKTNQTDVGPSADTNGTTLAYIVDTVRGNSGSPVVNEVTGKALGIHAQGNCFSLGGRNFGTSFFHPSLWKAINRGQ